MSILNDRTQIAALDQSNVLSSIEQLADQLPQAWEESSVQTFTGNPADIHHVIVAGMGGSALGARVIKSLFAQTLKTSFDFVTDYTLPAYVNAHTLVIMSSYSGTTEETLACLAAAQQKQAQIAVITAGGPLLESAQTNHYPLYQLNPTHNPSNQPRMAIGYMIMGTIGLLHAARLLQFDPAVISATTDYLRLKNALYSPEASSNQAATLAQAVQDKLLYFISAGHLIGAAHVFNNQTNENAKHLTNDLQLPELNHHYLEALSFPQNAPANNYFLLLNSSLYSENIKLRLELTRQILDQKGYPHFVFDAAASDHFTQVFELIQFGSYTAFYLSLLHGLDPSPIPTVDFFKAQLKKAHH